MLARWNKLIRYLDASHVELDNSLIGNALWPSALSRKIYLFAKSLKAAQRTAVFYSLLGTCKLHGVHPEEWLTDVLKRIPDFRGLDVK